MTSAVPILTYKPSGAGVHVDLDRLVASRMLIQANSGGGKSRAIRQLLEETRGRVQHLVIDPEGEFPTLRERFDYVLAAKQGGDVLASPRTARLLCRRLVELGASAVLDLYELSLDDRRAFVRQFLTELMGLPRALWHPIIVVIDEMHVFCLDDQTEILTPFGWRKHTDIAEGGIAVTFDPASGAYSYGEIQRVIRRDHDGLMVRLKSDGIDCLATPDHRVLLRKEQRAKGRRKMYDWTFCAAGKVPQQIYVPFGGAPIGPGVPDLSEEMCRLLGWVITDGHFTGGGTYLGIEQSTATTKRGKNMVEELGALLRGFGSASAYVRKPRKSTIQGHASSAAEGRMFYLGKPLSDRVLRWLGEDIHRIPHSLLVGGSRAQLEALYTGLLEGDGTATRRGWKAFYAGKNEGLADDFQELAIRLGTSATKKFVRQNEQWIVLLSARPHHFVRKPAKASYSGIVWDVTVPTGAFVARRNGKVFVTGNCPEAGVSQAAESVITLATQGRKRGFCLVGATQRISKLHKDVAAELLNKMIGRTGLDIDVKRAGDELGMGKDERAGLKTLAPGEFYVYGPAIANEVQIVKTGAVTTSHPEAGKVGTAPPPPPAKVRTMLAQLVDLPKEAEEEARTLEDFKRQNAELARKLRQAEKSGTVVEKPVTVVDQRAIDRAVAAATRTQAGIIKQLRGALDAAMNFIINISTKNFDVAGIDKAELERAVQSAMAKATELMDRKLTARAKEIDELRLSAQRIAERLKRVLAAEGEDVVVSVDVTRNEPFSVAPRSAERPRRENPARVAASSNGNGVGSLGKGERIILTAIAQYPEGAEREQLSVLTGYKRSSRDTYIQRLQSAGYVDTNSGGIVATDEGVAALGSDFEPLPTGEALQEYWLNRLGGGERAILGLLIDAEGEPVPRDALTESTGYKRSSRDTYLQRLAARKLVEALGRGEVRASATLFDEARR